MILLIFYDFKFLKLYSRGKLNILQLNQFNFFFQRNVEAARYLICETDFNVNVKCYGTPCLHLLICSSAFPGCEQLWTDIFRKLLSKVDLMSRDDQGKEFVFFSDLNFI